MAGQQHALGKNGQKRLLGRLAARWQRTVREEHNGEKMAFVCCSLSFFFFIFFAFINS